MRLFLLQVISIFGFFWEHLSVQQLLFHSIFVLLTHHTGILYFLAILYFQWILYACSISFSSIFQFHFLWVVSQHLFVLILIPCRTSVFLTWRCYFVCRVSFFFSYLRALWGFSWIFCFKVSFSGGKSSCSFIAYFFFILLSFYDLTLTRCSTSSEMATSTLISLISFSILVFHKGYLCFLLVLKFFGFSFNFSVIT